jgi:DNA polymerase III epsilon subunit-like protein
MNGLRRLPALCALLAVSPALRGELPAPADDPDAWLLAFVDVETTGLVPGFHEMVDIGVILADLEGQEIDRLFLRIMPEHPERASPEAVAVNGFSVERWEAFGASSPADAVGSLLEFHRRHGAGKRILMVAHNSQFDAAFLDQLMRSAGRSRNDLYYYYVLDIPSMAWALDLRLLHGQRLAERLGIEDEPRTAIDHTGITGADLNLRVYRELLQYHNPTERPRRATHARPRD